jgi:hypothetical protein
MFPLIEAYLDGRVRRSVFCQQHNLSIDTFKYWQKKYHKAQQAQNASTIVSAKPKPAAFVPVHINPPPPAEETACELIFPNGIRLRFPQPVTAQFLMQLIHNGI